MQTINELKKLDKKNLEKELAKARFNLYKIQTAIRNEKSKKPSDIKLTKKLIAHILTVLNSKKNEPQSEQQ